MKTRNVKAQIFQVLEVGTKKKKRKDNKTTGVQSPL